MQALRRVSRCDLPSAAEGKRHQMVFPEVLYHHRGPLCGTAGVAADLVATQYDTRLEDRTHDRDPCAQLDSVPVNHGIHSKDNGVLQAAEHDVAKGERDVE